MASWRAVLEGTVIDVENHYDMLKYRLRERLGGRDPIMIQPYRGYGNAERVYLKGRVFEDKGVTEPTDNDSLWRNLVNMYKRFNSKEIPFARVRVRFQDEEQVVKADEEGFFETWLKVTQALPIDQLWQPVALELVEPHRDGNPLPAVEGQVLVPPPGAKFGVISDIDDTVVQTDATHLLNMARTVFLGNARTRMPFKGVAAFYRALLSSADGSRTREAINPLFYVSSSPWNIYDLLSDFFHLQNIPVGPILFLRDWGVSEEDFLPVGHRVYKLRAIAKVMDLYKDLPFILIGDSGQEDPEIYSEVVREHPKRILAIYIRNVSRDLKRPEAIRELAKQVAKAGSTLILADDTLPMAEHAAQQGWISPKDLPQIEAEVKADSAPPSPVEKLLGEEEKPEEKAPTVVVDTSSRQAAKQAVEDGAVEQAMEVGKEEGEKPPTVIIEGDKKKSSSR